MNIGCFIGAENSDIFNRFHVCPPWPLSYFESPRENDKNIRFMKMLMFGTMAALADSQNMNGTRITIREY
jgi:hypothetical protein